MTVACGNLNSHNLFSVFIDSQMKFAPDPSSTASMLVDVPLPCSVDPKTCGVGGQDWHRHIYLTLSTTPIYSTD